MKYFALIGLLLLAAILAVGVHIASQPLPQSRSMAATPDTAAPSADAAALAQSIARAKALDAQLAAIAARAFEPRDAGPLLAYSRTQATPVSTLPTAQAADSTPRKRVVNLLYSGVGFERAVIDGRYLRVGDRLADGGRVTDITDTSVHVRSARGTEVLHVPVERRVFAADAGGMP